MLKNKIIFSCILLINVYTICSDSDDDTGATRGKYRPYLQLNNINSSYVTLSGTPVDIVKKDDKQYLVRNGHLTPITSLSRSNNNDGITLVNNNISLKYNIDKTAVEDGFDDTSVNQKLPALRTGQEQSFVTKTINNTVNNIVNNQEQKKVNEDLNGVQGSQFQTMLYTYVAVPMRKILNNFNPNAYFNTEAYRNELAEKNHMKKVIDQARAHNGAKK